MTLSLHYLLMVSQGKLQKQLLSPGGTLGLTPANLRNTTVSAQRIWPWGPAFPFRLSAGGESLQQAVEESSLHLERKIPGGLGRGPVSGAKIAAANSLSFRKGVMKCC